MYGTIKFSVVTATYNSESTVAHAIESLKKQTWQSVEHVVIDGASSDNTLAIVRSALNVQDFYLSEPDTGIYDALNKGIRRCTGDVIGFLHSNDFLADELVLQNVAECFMQTGADAVYGDLQYVDALSPQRIVRHWTSGEFTHSKLMRGWMPPHPTFFMRRELYENLGLFDTQFRIASDYDAMLRYLNSPSTKVAYIPKVLVKMRVGGASNGSLMQILKKSREDFIVMKRNGLNPYLALPYKNISKISQFLIKR